MQTLVTTGATIAYDGHQPSPQGVEPLTVMHPAQGRDQTTAIPPVGRDRLTPATVEERVRSQEALASASWSRLQGGTIPTTGTAPTLPFGFSTTYTDPQTGHLYCGYRFYDPVSGRWLSRDPIGERGGVHPYGVGDNDPVTFWDYMGPRIQGRWDPPDWGQRFGTSVDIYYTAAHGDCPNGEVLLPQTVRSGGLATLMEYGAECRQLFGVTGSDTWEWDVPDSMPGHCGLATDVVAPDPATGIPTVLPGREDSPGGLDNVQMEFLTVAHCPCPGDEGLGRASGQLRWGFSYRNGDLFVWGLGRGP